MKQSAVFLTVAAVLTVLPPAVRAGAVDLYDIAVSTSNGVSGDWQDTSTIDPFAIFDGSSTITETGLGANCCGDGVGGTTPGIGTINYTFNPGAPGTYTVSLYLDHDVSIPDYNEFGLINNAGAAQSGVTGEIFNANSTSGNIYLYGASGTPGGELYGTADGTNGVPGTTSNFLVDCDISSNASCDADVGDAISYTFTLSAGQYAVISAGTSLSDPGGFSLETIHPADANNAAASQVYLTGSYTINTETSGAPEPSTWLLMGTALALLGFGEKRRGARV